jgi:hypothetical protein
MPKLFPCQTDADVDQMVEAVVDAVEVAIA